jgi:hypothetical protein
MSPTLLFTGIITHSTYDSLNKVVQLSISEEDLTYTTIDASGTIRVHSIDDAFAILKPDLLVTLVASDEIVSNVVLTSTSLLEKPRFFKRPLLYLSFSFVGDVLDHKKLSSGSPLQVYVIAG